MHGSIPSKIIYPWKAPRVWTQDLCNLNRVKRKKMGFQPGMLGRISEASNMLSGCTKKDEGTRKMGIWKVGWWSNTLGATASDVTLDYGDWGRTHTMPCSSPNNCGACVNKKLHPITFGSGQHLGSRNSTCGVELVSQSRQRLRESILSD